MKDVQIGGLNARRESALLPPAVSVLPAQPRQSHLLPVAEATDSPASEPTKVPEARAACSPSLLSKPSSDGRAWPCDDGARRVPAECHRIRLAPKSVTTARTARVSATGPYGPWSNCSPGCDINKSFRYPCMSSLVSLCSAALHCLASAGHLACCLSIAWNS